MNITRNLKVPTGNILVVEGSKGKLEMLSLYDYGKERNVVADFLGLSRPLDKVEHTNDMLPLEKKWVITISTQYGCKMRCRFCSVPLVEAPYSNINTTFDDLIQQVQTGIQLHSEVTHCEHLNVHFARMGEPSFNPHVLDCAKWLRNNLYLNQDGSVRYNIHPVVSTMMPKRNEWLQTFIHSWMLIKNQIYEGNAGLQLSINSTSEDERNHMFRFNQLPLADIASIMKGQVPVGRKITLNFAVAKYEIDPSVLLRYFDPAHYIVKLTPMHRTQVALKNGIATEGDYTTYEPYKAHEKALKKAGYDVLVFIASREEDEGLITCGNAILRGHDPTVPFEELPVA
jgi:23S rRNA (adenine2503-C2)-methyltransferase